MESALGHQRDHARRKARAIYRLGKAHHDERTGFRHLVEIRQQLNLVVIGPEDVALERIVILIDREARIGVRGLMTRGCDLSGPIEK